MYYYREAGEENKWGDVIYPGMIEAIKNVLLVSQDYVDDRKVFKLNNMSCTCARACTCTLLIARVPWYMHSICFATDSSTPRTIGTSLTRTSVLVCIKDNTIYCYCYYYYHYCCYYYFCCYYYYCYYYRILSNFMEQIS